jgi:hypothetical protein
MEEGNAPSAENRQQESPPWRVWLRATIWTTAVISSFLCWWIYRARQQKEAVNAVIALGGRIVYADDLPFKDPPVPVLWLERTLGHDYTSSIGLVNLVGTRIDNEDLSLLAKLGGLRALRLDGADIDDEGLETIGKFKRLEELSLASTRVTDAGLSHLSGLSRLEYLYLHDTAISNAGLAHFERLTALKCLELGRTRVTAWGARKLSQALPETRITY